nr:MAG TPA: hypothetical protein [Caudoviricetes sp.]
MPFLRFLSHRQSHSRIHPSDKKRVRNVRRFVNIL